MFFHIGILGEDDQHIGIIEILSKRIIEAVLGIQKIEYTTKTTRGSIDGQIISSRTYFFEFSNPPCNLAIYVTDTDGKSIKCKNVRDKVTKVYLDNKYPFVVACPHHEIEQWIFDERNAATSELKFKNSVLPYADMDPKQRFERIVREQLRDYAILPEMVAKKIAERMNLDVLINNSPSFKAFKRDLHDILKSMNSQI
ncbi:MAG: hypothetical protein A3A97_01220 [Candidatus Terrybacteria bacterium RIFCSPLOWO2_01_FULL_40_23]|uniref:DUF4276 family protein n=1 Tax=Candidatus Terrybacteria bacterium RIFCSPLOWO2_01_FULL_40_23 TaxID=1802366 RepID=A0A1G2PWP5_9BACT|nr:MAG: hypothetical protein A3A97_01220 [Candidatus Terrybacteria bacterium RIFCSPLOWO2_01_FULL_40_23]